jgi:Pentapeptide repeats (8 copies)
MGMGPILTMCGVVLLLGCLDVAALAAEGVAGGQSPGAPCEGPYKDGAPKAEELATVLREHKVWVEKVTRKQLQKSQELRENIWAIWEGVQTRWFQRGSWLAAEREVNDIGRANLCRAALSKADLQSAILTRANFRNASLPWADLQNANLAGANVQNAGLLEANLQGASLQGTDLRGASLAIANLQSADLRGANLQGALLIGTDLRNADLAEANLQGTYLGSAKLTGVIYEPKPESLPQIFSLLNSRLEDMVFHTSPAALLTLRETFKKAGMRAQERQLTYAVKYTERLQAWDPSIKQTWRHPNPLAKFFNRHSRVM